MALLVLTVPISGGRAHAEVPSCSLCGGGIEGRYTRYEDLGWDVCSECQAAQRCAGCELPLVGHLVGSGSYCTRCEQSAARCASCGLPALEVYWTVAGVDGVFCRRCSEEAPRCSACRRPAFDGSLRDTRFFCRSCDRGVVEDSSVYDTVFDRVAAIAQRKLGLELARTPELVVASKRDLVSAGDGEFPADFLCGLYQQDRFGRSSILVLSHLSEARAASVLAHEFAHAWQAEQCPRDQGRRLREGFAEWVAWKVLEDVEGTGAERRVIEARSDEYGHGFQMFAGIEARQGTDAALRYAQVARRGAAPR